MTSWLQSRFQSDVSAGAVPQFLDKTTLLVPSLAVRALASELARILLLARDAMRQTLPQKGDVNAQADRQTTSTHLRNDLKRLLGASEEFVDQMNRVEMDEATGDRLADLLRVRRYLDNVIDGESEVIAFIDELALLGRQENVALHDAYEHYLAALHPLLVTDQQVAREGLGDGRGPQAAQGQSEEISQVMSQQQDSVERTEQFAVSDELTQSFEQAYQALKLALLKAGAAGTFKLESMENTLQRISAQRRAVQQLTKAQHWLGQACAG